MSGVGIELFPNESSSQIQFFAVIIKLPYANRAQKLLSAMDLISIYRKGFLYRGILTAERVSEHANFSALK